VQVDVEEHVLGGLLAVPRVRTDADVVQHGHAAEELDVLECARDAALDHAVRRHVEQALPSKRTSPSSGV
jgi:hypothetical protein